MNIIDLYCGLGGWANGLIDSGHNVIGYDIIDFSNNYKGKFIQCDLLTYNNFPKADVIVSSPPCADFSKDSFPKTWIAVKKYPPNIPLAIKLFNRTYEIVDMVNPKYFLIENVRASQKYIGKSVSHIGSRYFYGNFPGFNVDSNNDIYGKTNMKPSKDRAMLRAVIPYSISLALGKKLKEIEELE